MFTRLHGLLRKSGQLRVAFNGLSHSASSVRSAAAPKLVQTQRRSGEQPAGNRSPSPRIRQLRKAGNMHQSQLSDVQLTNLNLLLTIRDAVHRDRAGACSKFAIHSAQAERISTMSIPQTFALVANVGDANAVSCSSRSTGAARYTAAAHASPSRPRGGQRYLVA